MLSLEHLLSVLAVANLAVRAVIRAYRQVDTSFFITFFLVSWFHGLSSKAIYSCVLYVCNEFGVLLNHHQLMR